jgi:hypothetical protein
VKKVESLSVQSAIRVELEIGLGVRKHGKRIVLEFVNMGEKEVCLGFIGV